MLNKTEDATKFYVDAMLGNIARKLRLLGFDTRYSSDVKDSTLLEIAQNENRIIISKDEQLIKTSKGMKISSILLSDQSEEDQLAGIFIQLKQKELKINGDIARCPNCNFHTLPIKKDKVYDKLPKKVLEFNDKFWKCENCDQLYWEGTHIKNLQRVVDKINERLC